MAQPFPLTRQKMTCEPICFVSFLPLSPTGHLWGSSSILLRRGRYSLRSTQEYLVQYNTYPRIPSIHVFDRLEHGVSRTQYAQYINNVCPAMPTCWVWFRLDSISARPCCFNAAKLAQLLDELDPGHMRFHVVCCKRPQLLQARSIAHTFVTSRVPVPSIQRQEANPLETRATNSHRCCPSFAFPSSRLKLHPVRCTHTHIQNLHVRQIRMLTVAVQLVSWNSLQPPGRYRPL